MKNFLRGVAELSIAGALGLFVVFGLLLLGFADARHYHAPAEIVAR